MRNQREIFYDRQIATQLEQVAEAAAAESSGGLGMDDLGGGDLGDTEDTEMGDDFGDAEASLDEPAAEDEVLLAEPPGKRDDKPVVYKDDATEDRCARLAVMR